jgi:hypothetical protein
MLGSTGVAVALTYRTLTMTATESASKPEPLIPADIRVVFGAPDPTRFYFLIRQDRCSPFVAACLLRGYVPQEPISLADTAVAIWEVDPDDEQASMEHYESDFDCRRDLRDLTAVIALNASCRGEQDVSPSEIVAWAIKTQTISPDCELARAFDRHRLVDSIAARSDASSVPQPFHEKLVDDLRQAVEEIGRLTTERDELKKKAKATGKQFVEQRATILAAALHCLSNGRDECINSKGRVVGAKLAAQVHDKRVSYGFGDDDVKPATATIEQHITDALSDATWRMRARKI